MSDNVSTVLQYTETTTSTNNVTLETEFTVVPNSGGSGLIVETWMNLNDDAVPQTDHITIEALPTEDSYFIATIAGATETRQVTHFFSSSGSETVNDVAAEMAGLLNRHADVLAVVDGTTANQINVIGNTPGTGGAFVSSVDCLTASSNASDAGKISVTAEAVAASGDSKRRKIAQAEMTIMVNTDGKPQLRVAPTWYTGATPPVVSTAPSASSFTGNVTMDALRAIA